MKLLSFLSILFWSVTAVSTPLTMEDFAKNTEFFDAVISPSGKYIAVERIADEGKTLVAVIDTKTLDLVGHIGATTIVSPFNPLWVSNERLVVQFTEDYNRYESEMANGELLAINANGKKRRKIVAHQQFASANKSKARNSLHGFATVIHTLPKEPKKILLHFQEFNSARFNNTPQLIKIDIGTGKTKHIAEAPSYDAYFVLSDDGTPMYSVGRNKKIKDSNVTIVHKLVEKKWIELEAGDLGAYQFRVIAGTENPAEVIIEAEYLNKTDRVFRYNLETHEKKMIFAHKLVDPKYYDFDHHTNRLIAIHFEDPFPNLHLVDQNHLYSRWYPAIFQAFAGKQVRITSATDDESKLIFKVTGANEPGQFHLFDTKTKKFRYLFNAAK